MAAHSRAAVWGMGEAMEQVAARSGDRRGGRNLRWLMALLLFAGVVLTVQAVSYDGVMRWLGEWQFALFGRFFPPLTIALILAALALLWSALRRLRRRMRQGRNEPPPPLTVEERRVREIAKMTRAYRAIAFITIVAAGGFVGTGIHYLQLPGPTPSVALVDLRSGAPAALREGSVRITGIRPLGPIARFRNDVLWRRQTIFFLPVGRTRLEDGSEAANLFVQVRGHDRRNLPGEVRGLLRTDALPPEIATMYRAAGTPVARESAVVYANERFANHATLATLIQLAVVTLIGALFALLMRRRRRRMEDAAARALH